MLQRLALAIALTIGVQAQRRALARLLPLRMVEPRAHPPTSLTAEYDDALLPAISSPRGRWQRVSPTLWLTALGASIGLIILGQRSLATEQLVWPLLGGYVAGLVLFLWLDWRARHGDTAATLPPPEREPAADELRRVNWHALRERRVRLLGLLSLAVLLGAAAWLSMMGHAPGADYNAVVALWLFSMAVAWSIARRVDGVALPRLRFVSPAAVPGWGWLLIGITVLAAALRVPWLDRIPYVFGGDEGSQAMSAVAVLSGGLKNPFGTGWYAVPTLFFFLQAAAIAAVGDSVFGARLAPALLGVAAVSITFLLARRLFGTVTGVIAALLLTTFHFHIHFSRLSSNQIVDSLAIVAVLYMLDRAYGERRALDALLAGAAIGFSQYFSFAGRIIPLVALGYLVFRLISREKAPLPRNGIPLPLIWGWIVLGAALSYAPLAGHYMENPGQFTLRTDQVSMFSSGWLTREIQLTGRDATSLVINQIWRALLLPFHTNPGGWYVNHRPFIGVPMAIALVMGLGIITLHWWRRQYLGLALAYWVAVLGLGLTEDPTQTQRFVVASSLMAIACAVAIAAAGRIARSLGGVPGSTVIAMVGAVTAGLMGWNLLHYFGPRETRLYGDASSLIATELAYYAQSRGPGTTMYFLGAPHMFYSGFASIPFIARETRGIDVNTPLTESTAPPQLTGPTFFAAVPQRSRELEVVRRWFPNGQLRELRSGPRDPVLSIYELR